MANYPKQLSERFWMVVDPRGQIGSISAVLGFKTVTVQYGSGGPFRTYNKSSLRLATYKEVKAAGLDGVGGKIIDGP